MQTSFQVDETFKTVLNIQEMFATQQYALSGNIVRMFLAKEHNKVSS